MFSGSAFGHFENLTGWTPGFAFILSFLSPFLSTCAPSGSFDCAVSLSEEASNAAVAVPGAIIGSIVSAGFLGTLILIILSLTMGTDLEFLNNSDQPLAQVRLFLWSSRSPPVADLYPFFTPEDLPHGLWQERW